MFPNLPYEGWSWPVTQHSGVISEEVIKGLIFACIELNGKPIDSNYINNYIVTHGLVTDNYRADSNKVDAWRDYQQILSEFGLIYSAKISDKIILTPIAIAYADGSVSYEELITLQTLKYQYPNGHKTDISSSLRITLPSQYKNIDSLAELQSICKVQIRPAVVIWKVMVELYKLTNNTTISLNELQIFVARCTNHSDIPLCVTNIIDSRASGQTNLQPVIRARRNLQDWMKLLNQTPLFKITGTKINSSLTLTQYALDNLDAVDEICEQLSDPNSFWYINSLNKEEYKYNWFSFYGNINIATQLIPKEDTAIKGNSSMILEATQDKQGTAQKKTIEELPIEHKGINFKPFEQIDLPHNPSHKLVVSEYDFNKSKVGSMLHDGMVNLIAKECSSKGANVFVDPKTVDLFVQYKGREFMVEVKSITPSNFIARLRTAIGQVHQYNFLMKKNSPNPRRLGLAFTASIPKNAWQIPFVKDYLDMDLLYLDSGNLKICSNDSLSNELYSESA